MELVYLWVEEYKNIKRQGFNFSPRFECDFDGENLTIDEKEYTSIFPDNINITAIVGSNGSGKSSILELIYQESTLYKKDNRTDLILIKYCKSSNNLFFYSRNIDIKLINPDKLNISEESSRFEFLSYISASHFINKIYNTYDGANFKTINNTCIGYDGTEDLEAGHKCYKTELIYEMIYYLTDEKFNNYIQTITNMKDPYYVKFSFREEFSDSFFDTSLALQLESIIDDNVNMGWDNELEYEPSTDEFITLIREGKNFDEILKREDIINALLECSEDLFVPLSEQVKILEFFSLFKYLDFVKYIDLSYFTEEKEEIIFSSGEYIIIFLLMSISSLSSKQQIIIDELDLYLHPMWQKKILSILINFTKEFLNNSQLIVTSHSPFILSDLPKENIIFLKNGEQDNSDIEQTFGANIHTLLSHGFFMDDGLMGEFAKRKIEEIKDFYKLVQHFEEKEKTTKQKLYNILKQKLKKQYIIKKRRFKYIQLIIGEPFLKMIIKNYLDELDIFFYGKNQFLDNEIKRLQSLKGK